MRADLFATIRIAAFFDEVLHIIFGICSSDVSWAGPLRPGYTTLEA